MILTLKMELILRGPPTEHSFLGKLSRKVLERRRQPNQYVRCCEREMRRNPWTLTHSFYAVMGGFAFQCEDEENEFLPKCHSRIFLTPKGLLYLAEVAPI